MNHLNGPRRAAVVLLSCAGALVVLPAAPASASLLGPVTIVSAVSVSDSIAQKNVRVTCPDDKVVVGVGASIGYTAVQVHITGIVPSSGSVTAYASEDDTGYGSNWYVKVTAVCANEPSGYEIVSDYHAVTSDPSATATVNCTTGKQLLGAAADVRINNLGWVAPHNIPDVVMNRLTVLDYSTDGVAANAYEDENGTSSQWILTAYAICADPVLGLQTVYSWGSMLNTDTRYELLTCPAGTKVLSAGGHIFGDTGEISFTTMQPGTYGGSNFVTVEAAEDQTGMSGLGYWRMDAWATCAPSWIITPL